MDQYPLLQTKLYIPPTRPGLVSRPRLIARLDAALPARGDYPQIRAAFSRSLTLISAPAGFGKTTLVSEWVHCHSAGGGTGTPRGRSRADAPLQVAWISLDESDNAPARFLAYLVAALRTVQDSIGKGMLSALQSPQPPPPEAVLIPLINELAAISGRTVLVLDDYHQIEAQPINDALGYLLERLPPQMHLVIATREDPNLPLARLRVRGHLTELRATDMRFTPSEAAVFFNQVAGLNLSIEEVGSLETRTEGWIAGLQLAALALQGTLSMQGREDVSGFIRAFAGDNRYIVDYLVEEVLQRQPEHVRSFLLQTSILERLSGPLCDAVRFGRAESPTGQEDGRGMLVDLERANLFVVPLDDKRQWYRYHHLFADVLQARLMEEQPDRVPILHRRASEWYEDKGSPADAIRHALAAEDFERTASLVELAWPEMDWSFQSTAWLGWVKALPDELVHTRPVLSAGYAWALLNDGELEAGEARLRDAERWLDTAAGMSEPSAAPSGETHPEVPPEPVEGPSRRTCPERSRRMVVVDEEQFRSLPATIASARAYYAQALGDVPGSVAYARRALDLLPEEDHLGRGRLDVLLGLAYWASGDLEAAHGSFADAMAMFQMAGNTLYAISFTFILADIRMTQGRLYEAESIYERSMRLATQQGKPELQGTANLHLGLSELCCVRGELEAARQHLLKSEELGEQSEVVQYRLNVAQARMRQAHGDLDGALNLLDKAERLYFRSPLPDLRPVEALKARVWIAQDRLTEASAWARERALSVDDDLSYLREFEHVTLTRVLIARYKSDRADGSIHEAMGLLERLLEAAKEGGRTGSAIEILVLQALAHQAQGDIPRALNPLERALSLGQPEGYVRIFVDEGPPMAALLREAAKQGIAPNYVRQLLLASGKAEGRGPDTQLLVEPLSERELEVLGLLGTELSGPEIARELMVSLNTMRTHTKSIYSKLGVNNRRAAVRRAQGLDLL